jgi:alpha-L-arabinofuranosidase
VSRSTPPALTVKFGEVPVVAAVATHASGGEGPGGAELTVLAVNRHQTDSVELGLDLRAFRGYAPVEHSVLSDPDPRATNTQQHPDRVRPRGVATAPVTGGRLTARLPPISWNVIRLAPTG